MGLIGSVLGVGPRKGADLAGLGEGALPLVIDVPSALGLRPDGVQDAPEALRRAGLHRRLASARPVRLTVAEYKAEREPDTALRNGAAIARLAGRLANTVDAALSDGRFPVVLGGDCSVLLGPLLALRRRGRYGLVFIDGHADFQHPEQEENGEVASLELALATGRGPELLSDLEGRRPLIRDEDVVVLGFRALGDNDRFQAEHITDTAITVVDADEIRARGGPRALRLARSVLCRDALAGFWVHLDVDVLDCCEMPAVDYRVPGGLSWGELREILRGVLALPGAIGLEVTIFNPRLDGDGALAARLSDLVVNSVFTALKIGP